MKPSLFFSLVLSLTCLATSGQKRYNITIKLDKGVSFEKIRIYVDNGRTTKGVKVEDLQSSELKISGDYYSLFAMIKFTSPRPGIQTFFFEDRFYVTDKPAVITLKKTESDGSPFENYSLINAFDFKEEKKKMAANSAREEAACMAFVLQHDKEIQDGSDSAVQNEFFRLEKLVGDKNLDYVVKNGSSYLGFSFFRRHLLSRLPPDSMIKLFNNTFPAKFKSSEEGKFIESNLKGKLLVRLNNIPPDFSVSDITGKTVTLSSFRKRKFVLLTFWATWCGPCIAKMPEIRALREKYGDEMEVISIAYPSTYTEYVQAVKDYGMNWINIYADEMLLNSYGGRGIPRVYLIDKTGRIIYENTAEEKNDMDSKKLLTKLSEVIVKSE